MSYFDAAVELKSNDDKLIKSFRNLKNYRDVCNILEVTPTHLHYILFKLKGKRYHKFSIPKKGGGTREILAPCKSLKILQQKLNYIMSLIYRPKYNVHGFVKERGIVSNAKRHLNKKYILNFDLQNFFSSINFGRVRGVLMSFFKIGEQAATVIANICCYENSLPQGVPTSPILSNMICFKLDKLMQLIAKQHSCIYTRYADDLTFSTANNFFPKKLATIQDGVVSLGDKIIKIVVENGFKVNQDKTRLTNNLHHMEVTGITVNEKLNVKRDYIKKVRAILRSLEIYSYEKAQEIFKSKYRFRETRSNTIPDVLNVVKGMISYIGLIRGFDDLIFARLALRYNVIVGFKAFNVKNNTFSEKWESYVWVVEVGIEDEGGFIPIDQGSGFLLQGIGLITNSHVIRQFINRDFNALYLHRSRYGKERIAGSVHTFDEERDIAIIKMERNDNSIGFKYNTSYEIGQNVTLLGYPNYGDGDSLYTLAGQIVQHRSHFMKNKFNKETGKLGLKQERTVISARIVSGNSGGPVVNTKNEVIGIASKGFDHLSPSSKDDSTAENIIVKIQDVLDLYDEKQKGIQQQ